MPITAYAEPAMQSYDFQSFSSVFQQTTVRAELRRKRYLFIFYSRATIAALSIGLMPLYLVQLTTALKTLRDSLIGTFAKPELGIADTVTISSADLAAIGGTIAALALVMAYRPILLYRGRNHAAGLLPRQYSLKDDLFSDLLRFFGSFEFAPRAGGLIRDLELATIIPTHYHYYSEDYICGTLNGMTIKIEEANLADLANRERQSVFSGLLIVIDISEVRVALNADFNGHTVLIADAQKELENKVKRYATLTRHILPLQYEQMLEAYTTDPDECALLLSSTLLDALNSLHQTLLNSGLQHQHFDDKASHAFQELYDAIPLGSNRAIESEKEFITERKQRLDITKSDVLSSDPYAVNKTIQTEFIADKVFITIPHTADLFEPNSLFEPALNDEDRDVLFAVMQTAYTVTAEIRNYLDLRKSHQ
jgi:hypothetical protein